MARPRWPSSGGGPCCLDHGNPFEWLSNIADDWYDNLDPEPTTIASHHIQAGFFAIDGVDDPFIMHQSGQMSRFSSRRRTGIEYDVTRLRIEQGGNQLRSFIFHIESALVKPGEQRHRASFMKHNAKWTHAGRFGHNTHLRKCVEECVSGRDQLVHPKCQRRRDADPLAGHFRRGHAQTIDPSTTEPAWNRVPHGKGLRGIKIHAGPGLRRMAQERAQHRIDEPTPISANCAGKGLGQIDRFVDRGRLWNTIQEEELVGTKPEHHLYGDGKARERLVQNRFKPPIDGRKPPQDTIGELHREGSFPASNEHCASARSNKTSTPSSLLTDSTSNERAIARADGAVWAVKKDREPEAIGDSERGYIDSFDEEGA